MHDDAVFDLGWRAGYDTAREELLEAAQDVLSVKPAAARSRAQRIAAELAAMERHARGVWLGVERGDRVAPW